jgi:DNA-binding XRE family transcriptional regulator
LLLTGLFFGLTIGGMNAIAAALRAARIEAELSQRDVAEAIGVTAQFVCDIELGRRQLSEKYVSRLPWSMRNKVSDAMIADHEASIERLRAEVKAPSEAA